MSRFNFIFWALVVILFGLVAFLKIRDYADSRAVGTDRPKVDFFPDSRSDVDVAIKGVVGCWNPGHLPADKQGEMNLTLNRCLIIRVRDLDGWLLELLKADLIPTSSAATAEDIALMKKWALALGKTGALKADEEEKARTLFKKLAGSVVGALYPVINGTHLKDDRQDEQWSRFDGAETPEKLTDLAFHASPPSPETQKLVENLGRNFGFSRPVGVSLGFDLNPSDTVPAVVAPSLVTSIRSEAGSPAQFPRLAVVDGLKLAIIALIVLIMLGIFLGMAFTTNILRNPGLRWRPTGRPQLSLTNFQIAVWFFVVFASFLYLWVVTGSFEGTSKSALYLVGIAMATALGGAAITVPEGEKEQIRLYNDTMAARHGMGPEKIKAHVQTLLKEATDRVESLKERPADDPELKAARADMAEYGRQYTFLRLPRTQQVIADLLSEDGEITLHRFQMMGWTVGLAVIFTFRVIAELKMPDFPLEIVTLMGLSAGTYLGLRVPEAKSIKEGLLSTEALQRESKITPPKGVAGTNTSTSLVVSGDTTNPPKSGATG